MSNQSQVEQFVAGIELDSLVRLACVLDLIVEVTQWLDDDWEDSESELRVKVIGKMELLVKETPHV